MSQENLKKAEPNSAPRSSGSFVSSCADSARNGITAAVSYAGEQCKTAAMLCHTHPAIPFVAATSLYCAGSCLNQGSGTLSIVGLAMEAGGMFLAEQPLIDNSEILQKYPHLSICAGLGLQWAANHFSDFGNGHKSELGRLVYCAGSVLTSHWVVDTGRQGYEKWKRMTDHNKATTKFNKALTGYNKARSGYVCSENKKSDKDTETQYSQPDANICTSGIPMQNKTEISRTAPTKEGSLNEQEEVESHIKTHDLQAADSTLVDSPEGSVQKWDDTQDCDVDKMNQTKASLTDGDASLSEPGRGQVEQAKTDCEAAGLVSPPDSQA